MKRLIPLLTLTLLLPACATHLQQKESFLTEAGFRVVTPTTPSQIARVRSLPQGHITQVTKKGKTLFVMADARKNLLFVGDNARFEKYQQLLYSKQIDPAKANEKAIRMEENEWGPWDGPFLEPMMLY